MTPLSSRLLHPGLTTVHEPGMGRAPASGAGSGAELGAERGSGTVLVLMLVILGGFLMAVTLALAGAILQRHRAAAAADLAALAAVDASAGGLLGMPGIGSGGDSVRASTDASTDASASASVADPAGGPEGATAPGSSNGCDEARRVAAANDVQLDVCRWLSDGSVLVGVQAPAASLRLFGLLDLRVRASSRAGPGPS